MAQSWSRYDFEDGPCGPQPYAWPKLQDRGEKWSNVKMALGCLGYKAIPLKLVGHSTGAAFISENGAGEFQEAVKSICHNC